MTGPQLPGDNHRSSEEPSQPVGWQTGPAVTPAPKKRRGKGKWIAGGAALLVLAALASQTNKQDQKEKSSASSATASSTLNSQSERTSSLEKTTSSVTTPTTTPSTTAASTKAPPTTTPPPQPQPPQSGNGDSVLNVNLAAPAAIAITYQGGSNFAVKTDGGELLVNTIGTYSGTTAVGFHGQTATVLIITASGPWTVQVVPLAALPHKPFPVQGSGDDVFIIDSAPGAVPMACPGCQGNFAVWWHTSTDSDLLVNDIGAYQGTVYAKGFGVMVVVADGAWSIG